MIKDEKGSVRATVRGFVSASAWTVAALCVLMSGGSWAQEPPPFPAGGPPPGGPPGGPPPSEGFPVGGPAGFGVGLSSDPKLLAPLPPPSAEVLKQYPPSPDPHNLEGIWLAEARPFPAMGQLPQLPFTDAAKQRLQQLTKRQRDADAQGKVLLTDSGRCRPMGAIGVGGDLFPAEIIQTPEKLVILQEEGRTRWVIHLKGEHPKSLTPSFFGHSVGHWEGDTLVVDTVGLRASDGMFGIGMRSDQARIVSRMRKTDGGMKLELASTVYDPQTYTQPFEDHKSVSTWHPELLMLEFQCEENLEGAREGMVE